MMQALSELSTPTHMLKHATAGQHAQGQHMQIIWELSMGASDCVVTTQKCISADRSVVMQHSLRVSRCGCNPQIIGAPMHCCTG